MMARFRVGQAILAAGILLLSALPAYAQGYGAPYSPYPAISPWMSLYQKQGGPLDPYHTFVQPQLQLLDLSFHLLRLATELHTSQLGDQQFQLLDLRFARGQLLVFAKQLFVLGLKLLVLEENQGLQRGGIERIEVGKRRAQRHRARSMPETFPCATKMCIENNKSLREIA